MLYPVILAGGKGTRLWPISTKKSPKQIKNILGDNTLLQATYERLLQVFKSKDIFVVTNRQLKKEIKKQIKIADKNIFLEADSKGTAMAIGLAAVNLHNLDPEATAVIINSDAYVKDTKKYLEVIHQAEKIADKYVDRMLLVGLKPQDPETGYGYIELGDELEQDLYNVKSFKEKPDLETAKHYVESGNYLWNPAIFVFKTKQILAWYQKYLPKTYQALLNIQKAQSGFRRNYEKLLDKEYAAVENISIDYGLLEKLSAMLVLKAEFMWTDIGNWKNLRDVYLWQKGNSELGQGKLVSIDSSNNLLHSSSGKLIATIGIKDMVLVETDKVILLCPADRAQEVKKILKQMKDNNLSEYL